MQKASFEAPKAKSAPAAAAKAAIALAALLGAIVLLPKLRDTLHGMGNTPRPTGEPELRPSATGNEIAAVGATAKIAAVEATPNVEVASAPQQAQAAPVRGAKTIHTIELDSSAVPTLHERAQGNQCEALPAGEAVRLTSFQPYLTERDMREHKDGPDSLSSRRLIISVAIDMLPMDRNALPKASGRRILSYLASRYISIQARLQKDPVTGEQYLHHRPVAAVVNRSASGITDEPSEALGKSLQTYRGLGLFVARGEPSTPVNLRTLVLINRTDRAQNADGTIDIPRYEYIFVRAHAKDSRPDGELLLHAFATSDERTVLHWIRTIDAPKRPDECSLIAYIRFIEFSHAGLYPVKSVTRHSRVNSVASFPIKALNDYAVAHDWGDAALNRLPEVLDAIIDGDISPAAIGEIQDAGAFHE